MSALANYPKHLARRLAIRQRLEAEKQLARLNESIAYAAANRIAYDHVPTLTAMRNQILADIEAGKYWPAGFNVEAA